MIAIDEIKKYLTNEQRKLIRDFLNGDYEEEEIARIYDLKKCEDEHCDNWELEEDLTENCNGQMVCQECLKYSRE